MAATPKRTGKSWRWNKRFPEMGQEPIPIERVTSPEYFELEREKVFKRSWLHVGRVEQIPNAGDYFVQEIKIAKTSLILVRGKDGKIRAFHNVCQHRGTRLCENAGSSKGFFSCPYHGWVYDSKGALVSVPQEENFYGETRGHLNLSAVACDIWEGFIFINLDLDRTETLLEFLGPVADYVANFPFAKTPKMLRYNTELDANWKVVQDSQSETLHVPYLHKQVWGNGPFTSAKHPHTNYLDLTFHERHATWSLGEGELIPKPIEGYALSLGPATGVGGGFNPCAVETGINPTRSSEWMLDAVRIFPNFLLYVLPGTFHTHQFWPIDVDRTVWDLRLHQPDIRSTTDAFAREYAKIFARDAFMEDCYIMESMQHGLDSGAISGLQLQDDESFLRHHYWSVHNAVGSS